jgi:FdhD protein
MDTYIKRKIVKRQGALFEEREDYIAVEQRLKIFFNEKDLFSLYCTPSMIKELITGLLFTQGLLPDKVPLKDINVTPGAEIIVDIRNTGDISAEMFSRCLGGITFDRKRTLQKISDDFSLPYDAFKTISAEFQQRSELFRLTGCFHSAALSDGERILAFAEDVGRHNAVDKVIGFAILNDISFAKKIMLVSCRISSEIVSKCSACGIPVIASRAAVTDLAIEIAEKSGVTLIGFVRGDRLNIYTNPQRII